MAVSDRDSSRPFNNRPHSCLKEEVVVELILEKGPNLDSNPSLAY